MFRRAPYLLTMLLLALLLVAACGSEDRPQSAAVTGEGVALADLPEDASPEEVYQALRTRLAKLGPVRVEATQTDEREDGQELSLVVQLIDTESQLARQTVEAARDGGQTAGGPGRETVSVIGREMVRLHEGEVAQMSRYTRLRDPEGPPLAVFGLAGVYLGGARATEVERLSDGGWELVLEPQMDAVEAGLAVEQQTSLRVELGSDLLPRVLESISQSQVTTGSGTVGPDGSTVTSETTRTETFTSRIEYRFTSIEPLTEADVALELPEGHQVVEVVSELPLEKPIVEGWPQYWLGPQTLGLRLTDASHWEGQDGRQAVNLVYRRSGEENPSLMLLSSPREPGAPDDWAQTTSPPREGDSTQQATVAGREATVHLRVVNDGVPAFLVRVVFPDAVIDITGYGLQAEQAEEVLKALRSL